MFGRPGHWTGTGGFLKVHHSARAGGGDGGLPVPGFTVPSFDDGPPFYGSGMINAGESGGIGAGRPAVVTPHGSACFVRLLPTVSMQMGFLNEKLLSTPAAVPVQCR